MGPGPTTVGCSSSDKLAVAMSSRVRLRSREVTEAEVAGRVELRLAGEAGADVRTALPREPSENAEHRVREGRCLADPNPCKSEGERSRAGAWRCRPRLRRLACPLEASPLLRIEPQPDIFETENRTRDTVAKGLERISETDKEKAG